MSILVLNRCICSLCFPLCFLLRKQFQVHSLQVCFFNLWCAYLSHLPSSYSFFYLIFAVICYPFSPYFLLSSLFYLLPTFLSSLFLSFPFSLPPSLIHSPSLLYLPFPLLIFSLLYHRRNSFENTSFPLPPSPPQYSPSSPPLPSPLPPPHDQQSYS